EYALEFLERRAFVVEGVVLPVERMPGGCLETAFSHRARLSVGRRFFQSFRAIGRIAPGYRRRGGLQAALRRMKSLVQRGVQVLVMVVGDDDFVAGHLDV